MVAYGIPNCCSHNLQLTPTAEQCIQCIHTHLFMYQPTNIHEYRRAFNRTHNLKLGQGPQVCKTRRPECPLTNE